MISLSEREANEVESESSSLPDNRRAFDPDYNVEFSGDEPLPLANNLQFALQ
jgi:hypothetical protein